MVEVGSNDAQDENHINSNFCIISVANQMKNLGEAKDVELLNFVNVYEEICKFVGMLGKIFEFVEKDVREKIVLLKDLHKKDPTGYKTVHSVVENEKSKNITEKNSGTVAILHLNRALEFIITFMNAATLSSENDSIPKICKECYDETLSKHHPWLIRTAVKVAVYTLPTRNKMLEYIKGELTEEDKVREQIEIVVEHGKLVHGRIENVYTIHDLHKIA